MWLKIAPSLKIGLGGFKLRVAQREGEGDIAGLPGLWTPGQGQEQQSAFHCCCDQHPGILEHAHIRDLFSHLPPC